MLCTSSLPVSGSDQTGINCAFGKNKDLPPRGLPETLKRFSNQSWCQQQRTVTEQSIRELKFISLSVVGVRTALFLSVT